MNYFRNNRIVPFIPEEEEEEEESEEEVKTPTNDFDIKRDIERENLLIVTAIFEKDQKELFFRPDVSFDTLIQHIQFSFQLHDEIIVFLSSSSRTMITDENWGKLSSQTRPVILYIFAQASEFEIIHNPNTSKLLHFPPKVYYPPSTLSRLIELDFQLNGETGQFGRDILFWRNTLKMCKSIHQGSILRRIFTVLKFGGLMIQTRKKSEYPKPFPFPLCTALSHGGRVVIQLPKFSLQDAKSHQIPPNLYGVEFWNWILTGDPRIMGIHQLSINGSEGCRKEGKVVFKRFTSTHTVSYYETPLKLPKGRQLSVYEEKVLGIPRIKETKTNIISSYDQVYKSHCHWAMNISFGGEGNRTFIGRKIESDGRHGSLYIFHQHPTSTRNGVLMVGLENCEFGKTSNMGEYHGIRGKYQKFTPAAGYKWDESSGGYCLSERNGNAPKKLNGMFIDLSAGWRYLMKKKWKDSMIQEKIEPIQNVVRSNNDRVKGMMDVDDFVVLI